MRIASHICRAAVCLVLAVAAFWSIRLAWADYLFRTNQPANVRRAAELVPFHPLYQARARNLQRAVELNPFLSSAWLEMAQKAEVAGNFAEAERCLRQAALVDQQFEPRWALANFYFRMGRSGDFWQWIRLAAERSYGDRTGLYRLCWRMTENSSEILEKAIPPRGDLLADYLQHLVSEGLLDAAVEASFKLLPQSTQEQQGVLMGLCERLIAARRGLDAARIWNGMIDRGWLPYRRLDPAGAVWLTNADLRTSPLGKGFDWRLLWRAGVTSDWIPTMQQIRIELTGKQMEQTDLIQQFVPSLPAGRYSFQFRYRTQGLPTPSGLRWSISTGAGRTTESEDLASEDWRTGEIEFSLAHPADLIEITLFYRRAAGTSRAEGSIWLEPGFRLARVGRELARTVK
jgi:tetratricopeptide (TPR) repeat protein